MTTFAYIRVSTEGKGQTTDNQRKLITDAGFKIDEFISEDGVSGSKKAFDRPAFSKMMSCLRKDDVVIVTAMDRLGRNAVDVLTVVEKFKALGIRLRIMQFDGIDLTSSTGKMLVTVMAALAEMEKNMLIERTNAGIARAKDQGRKFGRPLTITPSVLRALCKEKAEGATLDELAESYKVPRNTIHRNIREWAGRLDKYEEEYVAREQQYSQKQEA